MQCHVQRAGKREDEKMGELGSRLHMVNFLVAWEMHMYAYKSKLGFG